MTYTGNDAFDRLKAGGRTFRSSILGVTSQTDASGTTMFLRDPTGRVLGQTGPDGKTFYYLSDRLGSITGLTNSIGERVNSFGYGPYGEYTYGSDISPTRGPIVPWTFTGGYRDSDQVSGPALIKLGIRYYNPDTGRFTQPDPTGQDPHYLYAGNNPVSFTDATGASIFRDIARGIAVGALSAAVFAAVNTFAPGYSVFAGGCAGGALAATFAGKVDSFGDAIYACAVGGISTVFLEESLKPPSPRWRRFAAILGCDWWQENA